MAVPRTAVKYATRFPSPLYWHRNSFLTHQDDGEDEGAMRGLSAVSGQSFSFLGPKISIGRGIAVSSISNSLKELGIKKPFIITGFGGFNRLKDSLLVPSGAISADTDSNYEGLYCLDGEPTVENARDATLKAVAAGCDGLLCLGGGSALDLGKAVAALVTNKGDIYDYLEVVGKGIAITNKPLPMIAVPTTSGTGSEVTKNAVLKSTEHGRKVSMRHDSMLPEIAIIDPSLTLSCPQQVTPSTK
jgi:alcohol dehydrogenase class IV